MTATHANRQERAWNIQHMRASINRLLTASPKWAAADAERGERTIKQLERQIADAISSADAA